MIVRIFVLDHLPNVTGVGSMDPVEESFSILMKLQPGLKAIGTLYNPSEANSTKVISERPPRRPRRTRLSRNLTSQYSTIP